MNKHLEQAILPEKVAFNEYRKSLEAFHSKCEAEIPVECGEECFDALIPATHLQHVGAE